MPMHDGAHCTTLRCGAARLGVPLEAAQVACMLRHLELLAHWNRRMNLTAVRAVEDMVVRHTLDSLAIVPFVAGSRVLDIGSGAGFPGLPLAMARPRLHVTLLERRARRAEFLRHVCATLALANVEVVQQPLQAYRAQRSGADRAGKHEIEKFDTLTTRAFAALADTVAQSAGLGARLLAMKGRMPHHEIAALDAAVQRRTTVQALDVPYLAAARHVIIINSSS